MKILLVKVKKQAAVSFKCPKCGRVEKYVITDKDIQEIKMIGIARVGFVHGDHSLIINFDSTGFVRGAYIVPSSNIPPDVRTYYRGYRILGYPKIESEIELIIIDDGNKVIDLRLASISGKDIIGIMNYLESYRTAIKGIARRVGIGGRSFNILSHDDLIILYNNIHTKKIKTCITCIEKPVSNPETLVLALKYVSSKKPEEIDSDIVKERIKKLINAHRILIKAKKGTNAIRFARASILALWPELTKLFDAIVADPHIFSEAGIPLLDLIREHSNIDLDDLFNMFKELKKRGLLEIVKEN